MMLVSALLSVVVIALLLWIWHRGKRDLPPGPWGLPLVGYLPWLDPLQPYLTLTNLSKSYGPIYSLRLGSLLAVVVTDPELIREALAQDAFSGRAPLYLTHGIMQGYGLICAEGELWKDQRKFVATCLRNFGMVKFGPRRDRMEQRINVGVQQCLEKLESAAGQPTLILPILLHTMGNVMNSLVFGRVWAEDDPTWRWLQHLQEDGTKYIGVAGPVNFLPFLRFIPKFRRTLDMLLEGKKKTHEVYAAIIREHQESGSQEDNVIDAFLAERSRKGTDCPFYSDAQFYHLLADLFGAGVDTTMTTLHWFLLYMAKYPDVQLELQEELDSVVPPDRGVLLEDFPALPYVEAAISETQRIRSVVPLGIPHGTTQETDLGGYRIPAGSMVVPLQWAVHMDPEYWKNPEKFNPRRFLDYDGHYAKPELFIPFQTGKRRCVGEELGRMMLFLFGASILKKFTVSARQGLDIDLEGECGITLTPIPQPLIFTLRQ